jgi:hypothetical protein
MASRFDDSREHLFGTGCGSAGLILCSSMAAAMALSSSSA